MKPKNTRVPTLPPSPDPHADCRSVASVLARVGELDQATPPPKSEAIVKACKNARLEVVPGAGHALVLEDLDGVVGAARRLFA